MSDRDILADLIDFALGEFTQPVDIAEHLIAADVRPPARVIETDEELAGTVPDGSIVRSNAGTIACRFDYGAGVVFGDDRPFPWGSLDLPVTVLWTPEDRPMTWCMCGHHERWHAGGPCTFHSDTEKCRCPLMEAQPENGDTQ